MIRRSTNSFRFFQSRCHSVLRPPVSMDSHSVCHSFHLALWTQSAAYLYNAGLSSPSTMRLWTDPEYILVSFFHLSAPSDPSTLRQLQASRSYSKENQHRPCSKMEGQWSPSVIRAMNSRQTAFFELTSRYTEEHAATNCQPPFFCLMIYSWPCTVLERTLAQQFSLRSPELYSLQ